MGGKKMNQDHVLKINRIGSNGVVTDNFPIYTMRDGLLFRTIAHPMGWSECPDYKFGSDGKFYRTKHHLQGISLMPEYEFGPGGMLYRTQTHVEGSGSDPEFVVLD